VTLVFRYAACTHIGLVSSQNEDSGYASPQLIAVADGMGGHVFGEVASAITVATVHEFDAAGHLDSVPALRNVMATANARLADRIRRDPRLDGMGTTLTALLLLGDHEVGLVHIGDSRAYLHRNGQFAQITHDDTFVQSLIDEGRITPDEAATHPQRMLLLQALSEAEARPDVTLHDVRAGDRYLLCSDGLHRVLSDDTLREVLGSIAEPEEAVGHLVDLANQQGGPDNVACVIADITER
jgi:protein phosphatase